MRVISFHADGIHSAAENGFFDWATAQEADFICVQNLGCSEYDLQSDVFFPADYNAYFFDAVEGGRDGVALYCRQLPKAIMTGLGFSDFDMEGRYIQADYSNVSVGCLLVPPGGEPGSDEQARKLEFLGLLQNHLSKIRNKRREFIICGGWQIAHTAIDVQDMQQNSGRLTEERQWMDETLELGYVDAFREVNSDQDEFSWWPDTVGNPEQPRDHNGLRTDLQVVSAGMKYAVEYGAIYKGQVFASHAPLIMDYDLEPVT
ncbi:MAG: exodeoxyribonuclease III [Halieaceae bacterium]|jgi:exodeoxyribonuclease-3|nr:exodeoxyribonuclease III [Halieaceae bacterium]